jgi:transposase-like protein
MERKVKYDYAFKLECVKLVLEKCYSCNYVSVEKGIEIKPSQMDWVYKVLWSHWFVAAEESKLFGCF